LTVKNSPTFMESSSLRVTGFTDFVHCPVSKKLENVSEIESISILR
jgi:hypothetical protein